MSRLVSQILLAVLMIPAAILVFAISVFLVEEASRFGPSRPSQFILCGAITWLFMAIYWFLLWRGSIHWTARRTTWTVVAFVGSVLIAGVIGMGLDSIDRDAGDVFASVIAPIVWLICVTVLWRETSVERIERIRLMDRAALVCPSCGYNLTGLQSTRCPECGTLYTLSELIASQPSRTEYISE